MQCVYAGKQKVILTDVGPLGAEETKTEKKEGCFVSSVSADKTEQESSHVPEERGGDGSRTLSILLERGRCYRKVPLQVHILVWTESGEGLCTFAAFLACRCRPRSLG